jgi:SAM-dependent methyltransferase
MARHLHEVLNELPQTYWRYAARHELFLRLWERHRQPRSRYRVLDVGCGSGSLLAYLAARAPVTPVGMDLFPGALTHARRHGLHPLSVADAAALPIRGECVDLVLAQDVVEHVADDAALLANAARVCVPGGLALVAAPAFQALWSTRDVRLGHHRRYRLARLAERVRAAGFELLHRTYLDLFLVLPLGAAVALAPRSADGVPHLPFEAPGGSGFVNRALLTVSRAEAAVALRLGLPVGVTALVLGVRPGRR